ncbi:uncharacterized protein EDB91DRAFT_1082693 [Suillus paluster]|uniref:uncharacterized protein n=1 Tax=Suillus paluster TaxID=48578 RepID=UPI001B87B209|nr:uncharacterized protein EDB91DRAFT_1082693 [Suillus paluster]KAG1738661.1 hypothetical protein EDB91DRAFT_1082693 [Suillus paluster]
MNSHPTVRFNDPLVTEYYSMDVDDSTQSRTSTDDLYLGPDDEIEDDSVSSSGPGVLAAIPGTFITWILPCMLTKLVQINYLQAQYDQSVQYIDPDLYLGPDEDLIDCDDEPGLCLCTVFNVIPAERIPAHPEVTNEDLHAMVCEFQPIGSFKHSGLKSLQDRLSSYKQDNGGLPAPSIPLLIEAEQPF